MICTASIAKLRAMALRAPTLGRTTTFTAMLSQPDRVPPFLRGSSMDYEAVLASSVVAKAIAKDKMRPVLLQIPKDDWSVKQTTRRFRTVESPVPALDTLPVQLRECARAYGLPDNSTSSLSNQRPE
jgi:hypothetical protein